MLSVLFSDNCKTVKATNNMKTMYRDAKCISQYFFLSESKSVTKCLHYLCISIPYIELQKRKNIWHKSFFVVSQITFRHTKLNTSNNYKEIFLIYINNIYIYKTVCFSSRMVISPQNSKLRLIFISLVVCNYLWISNQ